MDINALLSPDNSPAKAGRSGDLSRSPRKVRPSGNKRAASGLSKEITRSPDRNLSTSLTGLSDPATKAPSASSPHSSFAHAQLQQRPKGTHRHASTPQMETLADLASMQQRHRATRTNSATSLRHADIVEVQRSPSFMHSANPPPMVRNISGQSLADLTMAEAPTQTPPPRSVTSAALSDAESQTVTGLLSYLSENSYAYDSHVQLIGLLHKGFLAHTYPSVEAVEASPQDPHGYGLLVELRQAREAMDTRFAVGEDLWLEWLSDETALARSGEERVSVTELYQKAVQDEPSSVKLWQAYVDWVQSNYAACNNLEGADQSGWADQDKEMCAELFTKDMIVDVLEQGVAATQWRIDESHLLWNRHAQLVLEDLPASPSAPDVEKLRSMFAQRLQTPHATSTETARMFWSFVSRFEPDNWEGIMTEVNEVAAPARKQVALREEHELAVQRALERADKEALFAAFASYLQWERKHVNRGVFGRELCCAVYERALLRFPTYTEWWLDYTDFVAMDKAASSVLPLLERATRHCPWSGDLWGSRILRADVEGKPHVDIEATKHRATNSGLLDVGGMEELLKVLQQWCSYLRRHAFKRTSSEDDVDTAEVGITMALEDIQQAGTRIYGKGFTGDPRFRLETIQLKFLSEARRFDDARAIYKRLALLHKDSFDFWSKYYVWEMWLWGFERIRDAHRVETSDNGPDLATAVLQQALAQKHIDSPEKVVDLYLNHFQQHESGERLQAALVDAREYVKQVAARRAKEAELAAVKQPEPQEAPMQVESTITGGKRKAEEHIVNGDGKRSKTDAVPITVANQSEPSASVSAQAKRDREHNTITVRNLAPEVQELDIKKFFRDIGQPRSINILQDKDSDTATATVEFDSHEDVLAAKIRNGKELQGREVRIYSGSQNTLYVANYPPEYDETTMRNLFDSYGEILSVRFPSLKYNSRRRFCYVQFLTDEMARAAETAMDGKMLDGQHKLVAKISNPDAKKQRSGAQAEGREVFVKNLERNASEAEVKEYFGQYGEVVSLNLVKLVNNKRTGTGFVVFASSDEANAALAANNKPFKDRILHVEVSSSKAEGRAAPLDRARKTDIIVTSGAASASPEPDAVGNGRRGSDVSMQSASQASEDAFRTARERKIAILDLPDTVNDARIRTAMERYGPITKIQLRRADNGAIVEFANLKDAFNVREGVDVSALGPNVRTGDVADLLSRVKKRQAMSGEVSTSRIMGGLGMRPASFLRPGQRGGRRGGLGFKRGGAIVGEKGVESSEHSAPAPSSNGTTAAKSNADFRAMLEQGKKAPEPREEA
ncbi:hypothetical protein BAUCODRAFT_78497 [Baudoinia panamericana UAMH 10762]|uniref:U4/U6 snRNA-associated-splicing factor PRP24 n=1 Tax=Baudoinia panamericana (strain UAMH 10762) TaxID=717646 RepID=M2LEE8_BAUPA|nr:uncharacterized protein BAUCODRAFT_78497 [Baudoinia panamericana UAMH 10762]EMC92377.1 hypothetical protein BAUCODRAFT_78497 [Baudoinia panamericana UAMH 10762]